MAYFPFKKNDLIKNTLVAHPRVEFYIYQKEVFYNNRAPVSGAFSSSVPNVPNGYINLYEYNVDRSDQPTSREGGIGLITPFIYKGGDETAFKTLSKEEFNKLDEGTLMTGSYPMSASISRKWLPLNDVGHAITSSALKNTLNHYSYLSPHYLFVKSGPLTPPYTNWDKSEQIFSLIDIPSIFYGSSIKKGTVELNFYISGTLAAQCKDINKNGELIQVSGAANLLDPENLVADLGGTNLVAGVVLYNEGLIYLTGSWKLDPDHTEPYIPTTGVNRFPRWIYFAAGANEPEFTNDIPSSSFGLKFSGSTETQVLTMFAQAPMGKLNHSNNYTYNAYSQSYAPITSSTSYVEPPKTIIKNVVSGAFTDLTESFSKETYISKIKIYDDNNNCIGIAKVATPIKKTQDRDITFKLKLDI